MPVENSFRTWLALAIVAVAVVIVAAVSSSLALALTVALFGIAGVLVASWRDEESKEHDGAEEPPPIERSSELLDAVTEPLLLLREERVVAANRAAAQLLGGHIVGEDVRTAIRHPAAADALTRRGQAESDPPIELVGLGTLDRRWQMHVSPLRDGTRVVHLVDRTGSYAAERMRVDFVANASHELRTPLASILGYVETLGDAAGDDPKTRRRFLKIVLDEARRMQHLVEDLMSLSRIEADKYRLPETAIDTAALVDEVCAELADDRAAENRPFECDVALDLPPVAGDRAQLSQMLHNLIGNALKYGRAGTPVTIALARDGARTLRLSVSDEGDGIATEHLPRLTERFYRVDPGRSRALGGTGLGLAIVKHIVERHRGRLDIASKPGEGTRVTVTLPVIQDAVIKR